MNFNLGESEDLHKGQENFQLSDPNAFSKEPEQFGISSGVSRDVSAPQNQLSRFLSGGAEESDNSGLGVGGSGYSGSINGQTKSFSWGDLISNGLSGAIKGWASSGDPYGRAALAGWKSGEDFQARRRQQKLVDQASDRRASANTRAEESHDMDMKLKKQRLSLGDMRNIERHKKISPNTKWDHNKILEANAKTDKNIAPVIEKWNEKYLEDDKLVEAQYRESTGDTGTMLSERPKREILRRTRSGEQSVAMSLAITEGIRNGETEAFNHFLSKIDGLSVVDQKTESGEAYRAYKFRGKHYAFDEEGGRALNEAVQSNIKNVLQSEFRLASSPSIAAKTANRLGREMDNIFPQATEEDRRVAKMKAYKTILGNPSMSFAARMTYDAAKIQSPNTTAEEFMQMEQRYKDLGIDIELTNNSKIMINGTQLTRLFNDRPGKQRKLDLPGVDSDKDSGLIEFTPSMANEMAEASGYKGFIQDTIGDVAVRHGREIERKISMDREKDEIANASTRAKVQKAVADKKLHTVTEEEILQGANHDQVQQFTEYKNDVLEESIASAQKKYDALPEEERKTISIGDLLAGQLEGETSVEEKADLMRLVKARGKAKTRLHEIFMKKQAVKFAQGVLGYGKGEAPMPGKASKKAKDPLGQIFKKAGLNK